MKKILPCAIPPITSYPLIANMMSVLWLHKEETLPWIADRFIQLIGRKKNSWLATAAGTFYEYETGYNRPMFLSCPYLYCSRIDRKLLNYQKFSFVNFIKFCIDNNSYLHGGLNQYHFSDSPTYHSEHYTHPTFIYGYDDLEKKIYIRDFFKDKYRDSYSLYDEAELSFLDVEYDALQEFLKYITIFSYRNVFYNVNISKIVRDYTEYLNATDTRSIYSDDYVYKSAETLYGLAYYDLLDFNFSNLRKIDLRAFHVLVDHKVIQDVRIKYLIESNHLNNGDLIIDMNNNLHNQCLFLRNLAIKGLVSKDQRVALKGKEYCRIIREEDSELVAKILENIK